MRASNALQPQNTVRLNEVKPTYWIHVEDDFVFHVERSYVSDAIRGLEVLGVQQLVYNRN